MSAHPELADWQREWQSGTETLDPAALEQRVVRENRRMRIALLGPVIVTVVAGGSVLKNAIVTQRPADITLAVGVWCFILVVWLGALWMGRGTWQPGAETTSAFLRLSILRCRSALRGIYFGAVLYFIGFFCVIWWRYSYVAMDLRAVLGSVPVILFGVLVTPLVIGTLTLQAKRKREELRALLDVQQQIAEHE